MGKMFLRAYLRDQGQGEGGDASAVGRQAAGTHCVREAALNNNNAHLAQVPTEPVILAHPEPNTSAIPGGPFIPTNTPVVGVCDHAVAVEDAADVLLRPVPTVVLLLHQVARRPVQRLGVDLVVAALQQRQHRPCSVDDV